MATLRYHDDLIRNCWWRRLWCRLFGHKKGIKFRRRNGTCFRLCKTCGRELDI